MEKEVVLPKISDNINSVTITEILVQVGDIVEVEDSLVTVESEKASLEVPSEFAGTVKKILIKEGQEVKIGATIIIIETEKSDEIATKPAEEKVMEKQEPDAKETANVTPSEAKTAPETNKPKVEVTDPTGDTTDKNIPVSPLARKVAREMGVNLQDLAGSADGTRITVEDVKQFAAQSQTTANANFIPIPDFSQWGNTRIENLSSIRKITAKNTSYAWQTMPHVTHYDQADITEIEAFRKNYNTKNKAGITITSILLKMMGVALQKFPKFNSSLDSNNNQLIYKEYYHIGVAADTKDGLLMPVIRNVDQKGIVALSDELSIMAEKARERKLHPDEMQGQTFVISNLGGIGGVGFTPIVFPNNCAILGVSKASIQPIFDVETNTFVPRLIAPLSLSYDHRVIDGAEAARFMRWICQGLEQPIQILF
jgi:pyruvate dehydrogenase E2 component (dihydrolipoamide acetyltransferase)